MQNCIMVTEARATGRGNNFLLETLKAVLVGAVIIFTASILSAIFILLFGGIEDEVMATLGTLWGQIFGIGLVILYCRFLEKRPISSIGFIKKGFLKQYLIGLAVGFGMFLTVVIVGVMLGAFRFVGFSESFNPILTLLFLIGFMIQGMFEEVICRGYIMVSISRKNSILTAIVCNSLLFALLHFANAGFGIVPFMNLVLFGVVASVYTLQSGNIWAVGALHGVWNFVQGCFFGLSVSGMETLPTVFVFETTDKIWANGGAFGPEGGLIVTIVLSIELISMLVPYFKKKVNEKNNKKV